MPENQSVSQCLHAIGEAARAGEMAEVLAEVDHAMAALNRFEGHVGASHIREVALREALSDLCHRVERDRREPDKLLLDVQSARGVLLRRAAA